MANKEMPIPEWLGKIRAINPEEACIGRTIDLQGEKNGPRIFLRMSGKTVSYQELAENARRAAGAFYQLGISRGDKVAIILPNEPEYFYAWFGLCHIGGIMVPVNTGLKGEGLQYILDHSDSRAVVVHERFWPALKPIYPELKKIEHLIYQKEADSPNPPIPNQAILWEEFMQTSPNIPSLGIKGSDPGQILYTSGTTGRPKGVIIEQARSILSGIRVASVSQSTSSDTLYTALPLFHVNAQHVSAWAAIMANACLAMSDRFSASRYWEETRQFHATRVSFLGSMISLLDHQPPKADDPDNPVKIAMSAGTPPAIWEKFEKRFGLRILEYYGTSEGGLLLNEIGGRIGSMGRETPLYEARIFGPNDNDLPPGEIGELVFRSSSKTSNMVEYYKNPEATKQKIRGGWLRAGDMAYRDNDGYFFFVDRKTDYIRRRGENISSSDIERVINSHPHVLESAAVPVPSQLGEDDVKVCVVLRPGVSVTPDELIRFCEDHMARFMVPRYLEFYDSLPKTTTEKVVKEGLKRISGNTWDHSKRLGNNQKI
jgi:crotonobetaine/carnitine-CoA ligase